MVRLNDKMMGIFQIFGLGTGVLAPQNKGNRLLGCVQSGQYRVGEAFPAAPSVSGRLASWDGQNAVE